MELFKEKGVDGLSNAGPTIRFIRLVGGLINAMMSRTGVDALRPNEDCPRRKVFFLL